jgi:hypothetical protein
MVRDVLLGGVRALAQSVFEGKQHRRVPCTQQLPCNTSLFIYFSSQWHVARCSATAPPRLIAVLYSAPSKPSVIGADTLKVQFAFVEERE